MSFGANYEVFCMDFVGDSLRVVQKEYFGTFSEALEFERTEGKNYESISITPMNAEAESQMVKKTFYCVVSKFFDGGNVKAICFDVQAYEKPKNTQVQNSLCDEYHDYFDTFEEAKKFQNECYKA